MTAEIRLLSTDEVAELLHQPVRRIERWAKRGEIPSVELPNGERVIDAAELRKWIEERKGGRDAG